MASSSSSSRDNSNNPLQLSTDKKKTTTRPKKMNVHDPDKTKTMKGKGYGPSSEEEKTSKELEQEEEKLSDNHSSDEEKMMKEYNRRSSDEEGMSKQEEEILRSFNEGVQRRKREIDLPDLPSGYRFWPADHELIKPYLYSKILGRPVHPHPIKDIKLSDYDASDLPFDDNCKPNEAYFYVCLEHRCAARGFVLRVITKSGYWEATGGDVPVYSDEEEKVMVGFKKKWAFFWGEAPSGKRSLWSMNEFRVNPRLIQTNQPDANLKFKLVNYAVCKIKKQLL